MWSIRRISADRVVTSPPNRVKDVFAFEMRRPRTSAETVASTAVDTFTRFFRFVSQVVFRQAGLNFRADESSGENSDEDNKADDQSIAHEGEAPP